MERDGRIGVIRFCSRATKRAASRSREKGTRRARETGRSWEEGAGREGWLVDPEEDQSLGGRKKRNKWNRTTNGRNGERCIHWLFG